MQVRATILHIPGSAFRCLTHIVQAYSRDCDKRPMTRFKQGLMKPFLSLTSAPVKLMRAINHRYCGGSCGKTASRQRVSV